MTSQLDLKKSETTIQELALTNSLTDAYLILTEVRELKQNLSMELDLARDRRLSQEKEFREFMNELWGTLRKIQAQFRIEAQLLNLISPKKAGSKNQWPKKNSNPSSTPSRSGPKLF